MSNDKDNINFDDLTAALKGEDRAGLVNAIKNKLQNLADPYSDVLENLTHKIRRRVEVLPEIQVRKNCHLHFFEFDVHGYAAAKNELLVKHLESY
ncbi:unnamed protein product [Arabis nemorensis]|uniref:Uncharacterized protein n=1 Tax=Arabis nemorensis TaxID=586526 RepID=A0A565C9D0_9BRAS|nr:unnamed protein product [Arabis nemorensis]